MTIYTKDSDKKPNPNYVPPASNMDEKKYVTYEMFEQYHKKLMEYIGMHDDLILMAKQLVLSVVQLLRATSVISVPLKRRIKLSF